MKVLKIFSELITWVLLPLLMPVYGLMLAMYVPSNQDYHFNLDNLYFLHPEAKKSFLILFTIFCFLLPALSVVILRRYNVITTVEMDDRKERSIPIFIMFIYCLTLYLLLVSKTGHVLLPRFIYSLPMSGMVLTVVMMVLNQWRKVSIHAAGTGILSGFLLAYMMHQVEYQPWVFTLAIIISGLVMSARMFLEKHTLIEVIVGWFTGTLITFAVCYFF